MPERSSSPGGLHDEGGSLESRSLARGPRALVSSDSGTPKSTHDTFENAQFHRSAGTEGDTAKLMGPAGFK